MSNTNYLWVEEFRPSTINECILPKNLKQPFLDIIESGNMPNMILNGSAGCGKTTVALALFNEMGYDHLFINGSLNCGIDTLRNKISQYASSVSLTGQPKVVFIDEADYLNCLEENEKIIIINENGEQEEVKLCDLPDTSVKVLSLNTETNEIEEDEAFVVCSDEKDVYEVELDDGRTIQVTADHPFMIEDDKGNIVGCSINDDLLGKSVLSML